MKKPFRIILVALVFLAFVSSRTLCGFVTDWWWYQEIQNSSFFIKSIEVQGLIFVLAFALMAVPSLLTIYFARKLAPLRINVVDGNLLEFPEHLIRPYLFPLLYTIALFISFFAAIQALINWSLLLPLFAHVRFNLADPIFHRNIGFYVFYLPLYEYLYQILMSSLIIALLFAIVSYGIQKVLKVAPHGLRMASVVSSHLSILLGCIALVKAFGYQLGSYGLLLSQQGSVFGVGYADFHARIPLLKIATVVAILTAILLFANIKLQNWKPVMGVAVVWGIFSLGLLAYPKTMQQFDVVPSELDKERTFLEKNIYYTREAYGLNQVKGMRTEPSASLTKQDIDSHAPTLENIRLWDREPLLKSLSQLQEIRPYYTFGNVDVDRYVINKKIRQVMLAARELDYGKLQNPTWANDHLIFTHGYGLVASPVNEVTAEGLPDFFLKNIPPAGVPELHIERPEIYYGENSNDYCIVNSKQPEFNYPSGDENKYTHYQGTGGIPLKSLWRRFLFAYRFSSKIFFSSDIDKNSRIIFERGILERLNKAFPLLLYDQQVYPVISEGRVYWICDAYTVNDHYPYAHPIQFHGDIYNYIRNSAKVVIDAYNGSVTYYVSDNTDPIINLYMKIFPTLFHPFSEMPPEIKKHIRVPEDYFLAQASVYSLYHMTNPDVFYNREDLWQLPHSGGDEEIRPYYVVMQMPGSKNPEFILMLPLTPNKKDNLAAWMTARCDVDHYGEKFVFEFPKESLVFGPTQIQARINQDPKFSQLRTLWGQQGSRISLGHLQVIPVGNAILYIEPLYLKAERRELPELKLVLLAYGEKIAIEENLQKGLASIFGHSSAQEETSPHAGPIVKGTLVPTLQESLSQALLHYQKATSAQKAGNWAEYGTEIEALGKILKALSEAKH